MAGGLGISPRVAATTIEEWAKVVNSEVEKHLPLIAMMRSKGRIKNGVASGGGMRWVPRVTDHQLEGFKDMQAITFERLNTKVNAALPWRGYYLQDAISLREKLEQGGPEAMIKVFSNREEVMRRAGVRGLADKFYIDGDTAAAQAGEEFHGIESFMGIGAQTPADRFATVLNDTYGGLSTADGSLDPVARDAWSPVIVNCNRDPGTGTQAWSAFGDEYMRRGILQATYGAGPTDMIDIITLNRRAYEEWLNLMDDKERLNVRRGQGQALSSLGFTSMEFDGIPVIWDAAVLETDANGDTVHGYGWNTSRMELRLLNSGNLFSSKVTFNDTYQADHIFLYIVGNFKFESPRHFIKFADIS